MYIARVLYPVRVLGPGERIGIWFCGCRHGCRGCSNPELWEFDEKYHTRLDIILQLIGKILDQNSVDGFTITGGEPFEQPEALRALLEAINKISDDIIIYTGGDYDQLKHSHQDIIDLASVIIDGPYIEEQNCDVVMRGSANQRIIIVNDKYREFYQRYLGAAKNQIQNFTAHDGVISVGIHRPGFHEELNKVVEGKGLKEVR